MLLKDQKGSQKRGFDDSFEEIGEEDDHPGLDNYDQESDEYEFDGMESRSTRRRDSNDYSHKSASTTPTKKTKQDLRPSESFDIVKVASKLKLSKQTAELHIQEAFNRIRETSVILCEQFIV